MFGRMFFEFCQDSGYDTILQVLGATTKDFLQNLDALHDHLATIYPGMRAPSFRCSERIDGSLVLHYYSEREGLEHIVIGIVKVSLPHLWGDFQFPPHELNCTLRPNTAHSPHAAAKLAAKRFSLSERWKS